MKIIVLLLLVACKTLTEKGEEVRIIEGSVPKDCVRIGEVFSEAYFGSNTGKNLLRNRVAEMNGNALVITREKSTEYRGFAYKCP